MSIQYRIARAAGWWVLSAIVPLAASAAPTPTPTATPAAATAATPAPSAAPAPTPTAVPAGGKALEEMSLEELLDVPISVATKTAIPFRETPGVVTLITHDQISAMGARDLVDVLSQVPGFGFGVDIESVVALGFRGNWVEEGKALLLVDGQDFNELLYLNMPVGLHLPVDQIDRIEIVRGPGSVVYGGAAELAVINIITRNPEQLHGGVAAVRYGQTPKAFGRREVSLSYGQPAKSASGVSWSLAGFFGQGARSDVIYQDGYGGSYNMANHSDLQDAYLNAGVQVGKLGIRYIFDDYDVVTRDGYDVVFTQDNHKGFLSHLFSLEYPVTVGDSLTITPRFSYKRQSTWRALDKSSPDVLFYDPVEARYVGDVTANWHVVKGLDALAGVTTQEDEYFLNRSVDGDHQKGIVNQIFGGSRPIYDVSSDKLAYKTHNLNVAGFAQALWTNPIANVSAGARYDVNDQFGNSFEPRVALTKVLDPVDVKLLASRAFRPPALGNLDYNTDLKPEHATALEAAVGVRVGQVAYLTANVFDVSLDKPMVYTQAVTGTGSYFNYASTGTQGAELTAQATVLQDVSVTASYSFYSAGTKNKVIDYAVPGHRTALLGFAHHKLAFTASKPIASGVALGVSGVYWGERFAFNRVDSGGNLLVGREPPAFLVNAFANWRQPSKGIEVALGLYNIAGQKMTYPEPYDGFHPPLPADPREATLHVSYAF